MRIGLADLEPEIAQKLADKINAPVPDYLRDNIQWSGMPFQIGWNDKGIQVKEKRQPSELERRGYTSRRIRRRKEKKSRQSRNVAILWFLCLGLFSFSLNLSSLPSLALFLMVWLGGSAIFMGLSRFLLPIDPKNMISQEEMQAVIPLLKLDRIEHLYVDIILQISSMDETKEQSKSLRETLSHINQLLGTSRQLAQMKTSIIPLLDNNQIYDLAGERINLQKRLEAAQDNTAREALEQSLKICDERISSIRSLKTGVERIEAQQEAILQAMASARLSITRFQAIPQLETDEKVRSLSDTADQIRLYASAAQKTAVEIQELRHQ